VVGVVILTNANTIDILKWLPHAARRGDVKIADLLF